MKLFLKLVTLVLLFCWSCSSEEDPLGLGKRPEIVISSTDKEPVMEAKGGTHSLTFTAITAWTANVVNTRSDNWCTVSPTSGEAGTFTLIITTVENLTPDERNVAITLQGITNSETFTVIQKQKDALTVTSSKVEVTTKGGDIAIEVKANIDFEYQIDEASKSWITAATTRGLTTSTLNFRVTENTGLKKREGYITIHSGEFSETVTVFQEGNAPEILLTQNEYTVGDNGETIKVELKSNTDYEVQLPDGGWISETTTRAFSSHTHYFTIAKNDTYDARVAEILFTDKSKGVTEKVKVTQAQRNGIVAGQQLYTIDEVGGVVEVDIASNVEFGISIDSDWIRETSKTKGLTNKKLSFTIDAMSEGINRTGIIVFTNKDSNIAETVTIQQQKHIYFEKTTAELIETKTLKLPYISVLPNEGVRWESSDPKVATVAQDGTITGVNKGTTVITVTTEDGKYKAACEVTVKSITDYISFNITSSFISVGGMFYMSVSSTMKNKSEYSIQLVSLTAFHPVTGAQMSKTTDPSLLGTLEGGGEKSLGLKNLTEDITPVFVWEYTFGGNRYVNKEKVDGSVTGNSIASKAISLKSLNLKDYKIVEF